MHLKPDCLQVCIQTSEQWEAVLALPDSPLVFFDSGCFSAGEMRDMMGAAAGLGKRFSFGLRFPQVFRERTDRWLVREEGALRAFPFSCLLIPNLECLCRLKDLELFQETAYILDHTIPVMNHRSALALLKLLPDQGKNLAALTFSLEESLPELIRLKESLYGSLGRQPVSDKERPEEKEGVPCSFRTAVPTFGLTVYGRAPMMVSAQCLKKTALGCDHKEELLFLKDRTGARMPVRNLCRFCHNTIYNAVPTVLYDLTEELQRLQPAFLRYEFTSESREETADVLRNRVPERFTRGHFKKSVL